MSVLLGSACHQLGGADTGRMELEAAVLRGSNIFTELGLTNQAAATAYAYEHELL